MSEPSVYCLMPTVLRERAQSAAIRWWRQGYKMAFFQNEGTEKYVEDSLTLIQPYSGVWNSINLLARATLAAGADVCVYAGDDMDPDPNHTAQEIAREYLGRFPDGFGIMQPCGDMQGDLIDGKHNAARICGSAWFGRGWIERAYGGQGPTDGRYWHFYADELLMHTAERLGVLWWRPDLVQMHKHWSWGWTPKQGYHDENQKHWDEDQKRFFAERDAGFPGTLPASA